MTVVINGTTGITTPTGVFADSSGYIGMGTTSPTARATLSGTGNGAALDAINTTSSTGRTYRFVSGDNGKLYIADQTAGLDRIVMDSSGRVTVPYQPFFSGYRSNTPTTVTAGNIVKCTSTISQVGSNYDASTGLFTCPVAGNYWITGTGHAENAQPVSLQLHKNGSVQAAEYASIPTGNFTSLTASAIITCAAGDTLSLYVVQGTFWAGDISGLKLTVALFS